MKRGRQRQLCVVADSRDLLALERTREFRGHLSRARGGLILADGCEVDADLLCYVQSWCSGWTARTSAQVILR